MPPDRRPGDLPERTISMIKGMAKRGDRQQDIAVWFGLNQARVNEIKNGTAKGKRYRHVPAATANLPPPGPYTVLPSASAEAVREIVTELEFMVERYRTKLQGITDACTAVSNPHETASHH